MVGNYFNDNPLCEISVEIINETTLAIEIDDGATITWIPKSQIKEQTNLGNGYYEIQIPEWLAKEKGLI